MHELKTIVTRIGEGSKIVLLGDLEQIDTPYIDTLSTSLLIGDAISVALLSYFVMPFTNRILHFWLIPKKASWRIALVGVLVLAVFTALVWYVFGLVPVKVGY